MLTTEQGKSSNIGILEEVGSAGTSVAVAPTTENIDFALALCGEQLVRRAILDPEYRAKLMQDPNGTLQALYHDLTGTDLHLAHLERLTVYSETPGKETLVIYPDSIPDPNDRTDIPAITYLASIDPRFVELLESDPKEAIRLAARHEFEPGVQFEVYMARAGERALVIPLAMPAVSNDLNLLRLSQDTSHQTCTSCCSACGTCTNCR